MKNKRALLVEDNLPAAKRVMNVLVKYGYEIDHTDKAKEALELYSKKKYEMVILDDKLFDSEINGLEIAKRIRERDKIIPIFMHTLSNAEPKLECICTGKDVEELEKALKRFYQDNNISVFRNPDFSVEIGGKRKLFNYKIKLLEEICSTAEKIGKEKYGTINIFDRSQKSGDIWFREIFPKYRKWETRLIEEAMKYGRMKMNESQ